MAHDGEASAFLSYGRLSIQILTAVTGASAIALLGLFSLLIVSRTVAPGLPYGDIPAALIAMGAAVSLAALASASAYFAQYALHRAAGRSSKGPLAPGSVSGSWAKMKAACHVATVTLMSLAYVAFGIGGAVFIRFCLAAVPVFARLGS